jgi:hypothetical protein
MSVHEYAACPERIKICLVDVIIEQPGFRSKKFTIATTILETEVFKRLLHEYCSIIPKQMNLLYLSNLANS